MKEIKLHINVVLNAIDELSLEDRELVEKAMEATDSAYAEYSHFYVGAALRLSDGTIVIGANQENAAFPSGLCAERSAIFSAQSQFPQRPVAAIAIAAKNENGFLAKPITPCGACRQVMLGIEDRYKCHMKVLLYGTDGVYCLNSASDLMPLSFDASSML